MSFASLMSAQIAKASKKDTAEQAEAAKFQKRSEIEAAREEAYRKEQEAIEKERIAKAEKKRQREEEDAEKARERDAKRRRLAEESRRRQAEDDERVERERRKRLGLPELPPKVDEAELDKQAVKEQTPLADDEVDIDEDELVAKLRSLNEPTRLFGESHIQRVKRYHGLLRPKAGGPLQNAAKRKEPIPTTLDPVDESETTIPKTLPPETDSSGRLLLSRRLTTWFNLVLREWAIALASRDDSVKATFQGKAAATSYTQAIEHLRPLFRKLEKLPTDPSVLPDDLLQPMAEIVLAAQERRYVDANDGYLQLSIGKAAWPIGVTMVGIHERSAREKLHESDKGKAHIMSDESTRKILQSIKRCLSFAQVKWPPEDLGQLMG